MPKDKILQILSKYGMDLQSCAPFFYDVDGQIGLVYQFSHIYYGILTRVLKITSEEQLEEFAYQYWWYQKYAKTYQVRIELSNYDNLFEVPYFVRMGKYLQSSDMKELLLKPELLFEEQKTTRTFQKHLRTVNILIEIISLKKKMIHDTFQNAKELKQKLLKKENEFIKLYNLYQKDENLLDFVKEEIDIEVEELEDENYFKRLSKIQQKENIEELDDFIRLLWQTLQLMESDEDYLKHKYLCMTVPIDLEELQKMKNYIEILLEKKKGIFSKKEDPNIELRNIKQQSETKNIMKEEDYISHERKQIFDKYSIISEMDYETLGDYLNDLDNMGILIPKESEYLNFDEFMNHQEFIERMKEIEQNLSNHEIQCLAVYHSFLEPLCDIVLEQLLVNIADDAIISLLLQEHQEEVIEAMLHLGDGENVFIRMQKMRIIDLSSSEAFLRSIILVCKTIRMMKKFYISGDITVFGQSIKEDIDNSLYHANFKTVGSPIQKSNANIHDIIRIERHVPFLYFSKCYMFRDPFFHDYALLEDTRDDILLILKDYQVNWENSAIIKVSRFVIENKNEKEVTSFCLEKIDEYRNITVSF